MKRFLFTVLVLCATSSLWAQDDGGSRQPGYALRNNEYYLASIKERNLARLTLDEGNYDDSVWHSTEAERYARLSDEYITRKMLEGQLARELKAVADRLEWAQANEAETYFPTQLESGRYYYRIALDRQKEDNLADALDNARAATAALAVITALPPKGSKGNTTVPDNLPANPNTYVVRPWGAFGDCFWNIAARFYGNPRRWPVLYQANKDKLPDKNNPDLIEVGTVIIIPDSP